MNGKPALDLAKMLQKFAYVPPPPPPQEAGPAGQAPMPPQGGDPNAQAAQAQAAMPPPPPSPTDPGMGAGAPPPPMPTDPAAAGVMPPPMPGDPSAGGQMPPIDPATGQPMDPNAAGGQPPPGADPSQMPVMLTYQDLQQILADAMDAKKQDSKGGDDHDSASGLAKRVDTLEQMMATLAGADGSMPAEQMSQQPPAMPEKTASQLREQGLARRQMDILNFRRKLSGQYGLPE